ncbi:MAG: hypothetical protein VYC34_02655, partial [Planctomycetota bacterium]|nr:hypothetical protein [Planctomycetota bacterium]
PAESPPSEPVIAPVTDANVNLPEPSALLTPIARIELPAAEIPAYDPATQCLFITCDDGLAVCDISHPRAPRLIQIFNPTPHAQLPRAITASITHVAVDPASRGILACALLPSDSANIQGRVLFLSTDSLEPLALAHVGFHPDALAFSSDGKSLLVANEGQPVFSKGILLDPPGSITHIDLSHIEQPADFDANHPLSVATITFDTLPLDNPNLRIHPARSAAPLLDLEPEYIAIAGDTAYISLQENSAIAEFHIPSKRWTRITPLPPALRTLDASDRDEAIAITSRLHAHRMPDQIVAASINGRAILFTADEGDDRGSPSPDASPIADQLRISDLQRADRLDPTFFHRTDLLASVLGRLKVCAYSGDLDRDGRIELPHALGARSVSAWDAASMKLLADTADAFDQRIAADAPHLFNAQLDPDANSSTPTFKFDDRSDDRGPEPEGLAFAVINDHPILFV